jgi:hypothetical protein
MSRSDNEFSDDEIKELIKEALKTNFEKKTNFKKKVDLESALFSTIKEFLSSFIILGYDLSGNPLIIKHSPSVMEKDALSSLLMKYVSYMMYEGE